MTRHLDFKVTELL